MDRLLSMRVFQRVVEEGSFSAAARALDLSPAVVTRLVADLEQSLGTRLLHRTTRKLSLTEAGNEYGARVHSILRDIDEAEMAAAAHSQQLEGTVRLLCEPVMASFFIAPSIARWYEQQPRLQLEIDIDPQPLSRLEDYDLAVLPTDEGFDANVVARPLGNDQLILCAAPAYLRRAGTPQTPQDLQDHAYLKPALLPGQTGSGRRLRLEPCTGQGGTAVEVPVQPVLRSQSLATLLQASVDGVGYVTVSRLIARRFLDSGQLVQILPDWLLGRITAYAVLPTRKFVPAKTRALLDFLVARANEVV